MSRQTVGLRRRSPPCSAINDPDPHPHLMLIITRYLDHNNTPISGGVDFADADSSPSSPTTATTTTTINVAADTLLTAERQLRSAQPCVFYQLQTPRRRTEPTGPLPSPPPTSGHQNMETPAASSSTQFERDTEREAVRYAGNHERPGWSIFGHLSDHVTDHKTNVTGDSALLPPPYHGLQTENPTEWLGYFKTYTAYKQLAKEQALQLLKVLARGPFSAWIQTLPKTIQNDPERFSTAFQRQYIQNPTRQLRIGQQLFTRKQSPTESVDEYMVAMRMLSLQMDTPPTDDILRQTMLAGLRPSLAGAALALTKATDNMEEFAEALRAAELMTTPQQDASNLLELTQEVKKLGEQLNAVTVRRVDTPPPPPSPRRVQFSDRRSPSSSPATRRRDTRRDHTRNNADSDNSRNKDTRKWNNNNNNSSNNSHNRCTMCSYFHSPSSVCAARGKICRRCNFRNHFESCCRTRLPRNPDQNSRYTPSVQQGAYPTQSPVAHPQYYQ